MSISNFRGFKDIILKPQGHVCLVGQPGAGRSDVIEALYRVLHPESIRSRGVTELDFYDLDTEQRIDIEVTLAELGEELEQLFFDHLELWEKTQRLVVNELADPESLDKETYEIVLRLCYRAVWNKKEEQGDHWVDFPKTSDADAGVIDRAGRVERKALRFALIDGRQRILDFRANSDFRKLVEMVGGDNFSKAIDDLEANIEESARKFSEEPGISAAVEQVFAPILLSLGISRGEVPDSIRFLPEGGSISGTLRSLAPALELEHDPDFLPLGRHSSTIAAMLRVSQALAIVGKGGIVVVDDFGEELDAAAAQHLSAVFRATSEQAWLSTRRPHVAEAFQPNELIRLTRSIGGKRRVFHGRNPTSKADRLASRYRSLQLLPAIASRAVVIMEGPHDRIAINTLANRLHNENGIPLPAAYGIAVIDAGAIGPGGSSMTPRLAAAARELGWFVVSVIDHDGDSSQVEAELHDNLAAADAVVRLPLRYRLELALVSQIEEDTLRGTLTELHNAFDVQLPIDIDELTGDNLKREAIKVIKHSPGLHGQFIEALPTGVIPPVLGLVLNKVVDVVINSSVGHVQL